MSFRPTNKSTPGEDVILQECTSFSVNPPPQNCITPNVALGQLAPFNSSREVGGLNEKKSNAFSNITIPSLNLEVIKNPKITSHHPISPISPIFLPNHTRPSTNYDFYVDIEDDREEDSALPKISLSSSSSSNRTNAPTVHATPLSTLSLDMDIIQTPHQQHDTLDLGTQPPMNIAIQTIKELYARYQNNPYMFQKMHNYICFQIPTILENMQKTHIERQLRIEEMTQEQDNFINQFLSTNQYFYSGSTETFFKYDGLNYQITTEDEILYHILTTISKEKQLMSWKQKTKVSILKRIKEMLITKSITESETIQRVYEFLVPAIFSSKSEAIYFLCVIGDIIFKKTNNELMFFISTEAKRFIRELSNLSIFSFGANLLNSLKVKYYQHNYEYSRLVSTAHQINDSLWMPAFNEMGLNILVVACHYSTRYNNADNYLNSFCNDSKLINYVYFLKMRTPETIVQYEFIAKYLQKCEPESNKQLSWKNMQYLWKLYLDTENLPNIMFQQTLKNILCSIDFMEYNSEDDVFQNMTSHYLPAIQHFLSFWKETITVQPDPMNEYEIEELCFLYRKWSSIKKTSYHHSTITDQQMLDYIRFYYPEIEIEQNKYVYNIRCYLWDKQMDIQTAINEYLNANSKAAPPATLTIENAKNSTTSLENVLSIVSVSEVNANVEKINSTALEEYSSHSIKNKKDISIYSAYLWYCKFYNTHQLTDKTETKNGQSSNGQTHPLVSKSYFEKYIMETITPRK